MVPQIGIRQFRSLALQLQFTDWSRCLGTPVRGQCSLFMATYGDTQVRAIPLWEAGRATGLVARTVCGASPEEAVLPRVLRAATCYQHPLNCPYLRKHSPCHSVICRQYQPRDDCPTYSGISWVMTGKGFWVTPWRKELFQR